MSLSKFLAKTMGPKEAETYLKRVTKEPKKADEKPEVAIAKAKPLKRPPPKPETDDLKIYLGI